MIKIDALREFMPTIKFKNAGITLNWVQEKITDEANVLGIPVAFRNDQVKSGNIFNQVIEDCVVLYHPDHPKDYFNFCFRIKKQGIYEFLEINDFGESKQLNKELTKEFMKEDRKGKELSYQIGSMIGSGLRTLGMNKAKIEEEKQYYACIQDILEGLCE